MAMMMTGRVLLVCALCVLWCGAGAGGCSEAAPTLPGTGVTDNGNNPEGKNNTTDGVGGGGPIGQQAASQAAAPSSVPVPGAEAESAPKTGAQALGPAEETIKKNEKTENGENEEGNQDADEEDEGEDEEEVEEKVEEEVDDGKEEEGEEEEKDGTSTTKRISEGGQEEPILSSRVEEASNKTKPQSTQTTGDKDPAADGAGTQEEKQNENKEANPKETPVESTVMKTTTATTGDSDGSTAVSHTTSPLFLLVACAAAAAVVAA
ncbi:Mucin-associated surface protein (MASP) [Trypanosoma cruzi]|uniref:Mucin-associated surface protein (MASP), putative n=2 Tax=Trypanosoma cruzi TaxID=5693 RepID=Q4DGC2_TRYCC|nr:mucin-associated surface protein (MASP), putative [Trypanosoma cruzi]EAN91581.1 mucin-associated surface protein (MASP), putative [Trypanosoma cruzi]KAF8303629.1 Mucin-associated surface protein (MASP), subgroup S068 [Trypanosoma cruzi]PWV09799.1 Mucin-associated surface protein (MASP) [Trypanosoma cruzi]|eukprot:XP_813432.1 mucin-associated surface protein (MASP) [Trypanosoma cruzi strain CL Brener]